MQTIIKNLLKSFLITVFLIGLLFSLCAFLLQKNAFPMRYYFYAAAGIQLCITAILSVVFKKENMHYIAFVPLLLFDIGIMVFYSSFHIKTILLMLLTVFIHFIIRFIINKKTQKKGNAHSVRRKYEKIRKKQLHQH